MKTSDKIALAAALIGGAYLLTRKKSHGKAPTTPAFDFDPGSRPLKGRLKAMAPYIKFNPDEIDPGLDTESIMDARARWLRQNAADWREGFTLVDVIFNGHVPWQGPDDNLWFGFILVFARVAPVSHSLGGSLCKNGEDVFDVVLEPVLIPHSNMPEFSSITTMERAANHTGLTLSYQVAECRPAPNQSLTMRDAIFGTMPTKIKTLGFPGDSYHGIAESSLQERWGENGSNTLAKVRS